MDESIYQFMISCSVPVLIIIIMGLILGLVTLFAPVSLNSRWIKKQGWIQCGAGILLIVSCMAYVKPHGHHAACVFLPRHMGMVFLILLGFYLWGALFRIYGTCQAAAPWQPTVGKAAGILVCVVKILWGCAVVVTASQFLIPAVQGMAIRMNIPQAIVSATMVAFGTSLPEMVTCIKAVSKGHGDLALGNIIGANILNILFVTGMAAVITRGGLTGSGQFSMLLFPAMMGTLVVFGLGMHLSGGVFRKPFSIMLLSIYAMVMVSSYFGMVA